MLLKLYQSGQPVLRKKSKIVKKKELASKKTQEIIDFMIGTLRDAPGVGLAAPQVGENLQIIIIEDRKKYHDQVPKEVLKAEGRKPISLKVLINPVLEIIDENIELFFEGCLSIDGYMAAVNRAKKVRVTALDRNGKKINYIAENWHARILQHEIEHLNGVLYIDSMKPKSFMTIRNFNMLWRKALPEKIKRTFG